MYLRKQWNKEKTKCYLSCVEGYWKNGRSYQNVIERYGTLQDLKEKYDDPIAHFEKVVEDKNKAKEPIQITINADELLKLADTQKNLGYLALSKIYHELQINRFFSNRQKGGIEYSMNKIVKLLTYSRILTPASKRKTWINSSYFFEDLEESLDSIYRCLDKINHYSFDLQSFINKQINKVYAKDERLKRRKEVVYYDVTNYYFGIDNNDEDIVGEFGNVIKGLRKKGASKEHIPNPIVQMGLFMDSNSLPITFNTFPGNTNDCQTMLPTINKSRDDFGLNKIIIVADKGLNTSENIATAVAKGDGFVFSESIRGGSRELKNWVLENNKYSNYKVISTNDKGQPTFAVKSRIADTKNVYVTTNDNKKKKVEIKVKQVAYWSRKYAKRARKQRENAVDKARKYVSNKWKLERLLDKTAAKYIKGIQYDINADKVKKISSNIYFDEDRLKAEEKLDGYYVITTSETKKSAEEIIEIYRGLWKIEESFKITKSILNARPVYLQTKEHIHAHFTICFISLLILRILEIKLNNKYSAKAIVECLNNITYTQLESNYWLGHYRSKKSQAVADATEIDFSKKYMKTKELINLVNKTKDW